MKTDNNKGWLIWVIVVLVVMNLSTFITIFYHQHTSNIAVSDTLQHQQSLEANAEKYSGRYFRDKLNLDGDQMDKFREINPEFRQQARYITMELADKRKRMLLEMSSSQYDTVKLNMISDSIGLLHSRLKKITYKYYLDLKNICNTEQKIQLEQLFKEMFTNDAPMGFPGKGGPGWQHGKRMN
jgi:hypothetical protein